MTIPKKEFLEFLKENKAFRKYRKGFNNRDKTIDMDVFFHIVDPQYWIISGFIWLGTPDEELWKELHDTWSQRMKERKEK